MTGSVSSLPPITFHLGFMGVIVVKHRLGLGLSSVLQLCDPPQENGLAGLGLLSSRAGGYEVILLLQNRQDLLSELCLGGCDGDLCWPVDP